MSNQRVQDLNTTTKTLPEEKGLRFGHLVDHHKSLADVVFRVEKS